MMDKVLVLMATYNGEKYLEEQLDSIFSQRGVHVAVLARDDGSSDGTTDILDQYRKSCDLNWYKGEHLHVQKGYLDLMQKAADTDFYYFAFSDQDDIWDQDKLKIGTDRIHNKQCPALYYCGQRLVDGNLNYIAEHRMNKHRTDYARFILNDAAGCTEVFNRFLLDIVNTYEPEYILMHDAWILKVCLAVGGGIAVDCDCHMSYRQHGKNVMGLRRDLRSKLKRVKQYINEQKVEPQMLELHKGYGDGLVEEYRNIVDNILTYKNSFKNKMKLLDKKKFDFGDPGLQMTYFIKVILNKL